MMRELLDRIGLILTGIRPSEGDEDELGANGIGGLDGVRVIVGFDRVRQTIPAAFYPLIVVEPGPWGTTAGNMNMLDRATVTFDVAVRVPGKVGALFGNRRENSKGVLEVVDALEGILRANERLFAEPAGGGKAVPYAVRILSLDRNPEVAMDGTWVGKRFVTITAVWSVVKA